MLSAFPGKGHRYLVDFAAFRVELYFSSLTSLTYTSVALDGLAGNPKRLQFG